MKIARTTLEKIAQHEAAGYDILIGNNPYLARASKWAGHECVRLAQTNHRFHGRCVRTIWAVRSANGGAR